VRPQRQDTRRDNTAELFIGSQRHDCQVETATTQGLLVTAEADLSSASFGRIHLRSPDDGLLDLDVMVRPHAPSKAGTPRLLIAFVQPPMHLRAALERLASHFEAVKASAPRPSRALATRKTSGVADTQQSTQQPPATEATPLEVATCRARRVTPPSNGGTKGPRRVGGQSITEVDTSPEVMLHLYRKALGDDGGRAPRAHRDPGSRRPSASDERAGGLWQKLKKVATTKL
jgi:hypothetical protein